MSYHALNTTGRIGAAMALLSLLGWCWHCVSRAHRERVGAQAAALPRPLQVWEDEGGQNQMADAPPAHAPEVGRPGLWPG
jgi:hypothetical protein